MGHATYNHDAFVSYAKSTTLGKSTNEIFTQRTVHNSLDPARINDREAVDSEANPETTPIIIGADVTGSMGVLADTIIRGSLGEIMNELYARRPVTNPQILCAGIGDVNCDMGPLQVTQFEAAGDVLGKQIENVWLEAGGGANDGESYPLMWAFAAHRTICDSFKKRGKKGYLFTLGDEQPHTTPMTPAQLLRFAGISGFQAGLSAKQALEQAVVKWEVFHLIVKPVYTQPVVETWRGLLGERALLIGNDPKALTPAIVSAIQLTEGADPHTGWNADDSIVVDRIFAQLRP